MLEDLGSLMTENIIWEAKCDSFISLADLIMVEFSDLGEHEKANAILDKSFSIANFDKEDPDALGLLRLIRDITTRAIDEGKP